MPANPPVSPQVNPTAELLLMCLKTVWSPANTARLTELTTAQWQALVEWARQQKVAALFYYRLRQHGLDEIMPAPIRKQLKSYYQRLAMRLVLESKAYLAGGRLPNSYLVAPDFCQAWQEKQLIHRAHKALQRVFLSRADLALSKTVDSKTVKQ